MHIYIYIHIHIYIHIFITGKFPTEEFSSELDELENSEPMDTHYYTGQKVRIYTYLYQYNEYLKMI
jgi:hypothetical protein